jgi:hypothetical protein
MRSPMLGEFVGTLILILLGNDVNDFCTKLDARRYLVSIRAAIGWDLDNDVSADDVICLRRFIVEAGYPHARYFGKVAEK